MSASPKGGARDHFSDEHTGAMGERWVSVAAASNAFHRADRLLSRLCHGEHNYFKLLHYLVKC